VLAAPLAAHAIAGTIVPVDVTVGLIKAAMIKSAAAGKADFLVDGFPRNQDNYDGWLVYPQTCIKHHASTCCTRAALPVALAAMRATSRARAGSA